MTDVIRQSFKINLMVMKICHLYPPENESRFYVVSAYVLHVLFVMAVPVLGILYLLLEDELDAEEVNSSASFLAETACYIAKLLPFIVNRRRIKRCIDFFERSLFATTKPRHLEILADCLKVCHRNTFLFLGFCAGAVISWSGRPLLWQGRKLPIDVWLPFDYTDNFFVYCCVYVFLVAGVCFSSLSIGVTDPLIAGLAYHATSQIRILKDNLQYLTDYTNEEVTTDVTRSAILYRKIRQCINHHDEILKFVQEYERCFSLPIFGQIASSVFVICFACLQMSQITELGVYFIQMMMYLSVILAQIFFYCFYGSKLTEESEALTNAVYMGDWYNYDERAKKALIILMERTQVPVVITAGKLLDLSLETFTTILRRSYSLVAVMQNIQ